MKIPPEIIDLADRRGGQRGAGSRDNLLLGMAAEYLRLAGHPLLVFAQQAVCDYDGWNHTIYLLASFNSLPKASDFADSVVAELHEKQANNPSRHPDWHTANARSVGFYAPKFEPATSSPLKLLYDATFGYREDGGYDSLYTAVRVLGDFTSAIVSDALYDALGADLFHAVSLNIYFENVGEASIKGLPMPQPD